MRKNTLISLFLKKNIFSIICLLLSFLVLITGTISYSKYINSNSSSSSSLVGSFATSASIDGVSGLSFTNTEFWSSSNEDDRIAMNVLRNLNFSVNNFKEDENGNKKVSDVKLKYNLSFSAPMIFIEKLAFQVFDEKRSPILPQIVIADLINANGTYNTKNSIKYNEDLFDELEFNVEKKNETLYIAQSEIVTITIEEYEDSVKQSLLFRMWDTSSLTDSENPELEIEGGKVLPPLEITFQDKVKFYRVTISMDDFLLPASEAQTDCYMIKLVTTSTISDIQLGSTVVDAVVDSSENIISYNKIKEIYGGSKKDYYLQSLKETYVENEYDNPNFTGNKLISGETVEAIITGNINLYKDGNTSKNISSQKSETITNNETIEVKSANTNDSNISWEEYTIKNNITKDNYMNNTIAISTIDNKTYYIHKLEVERTGTQEIEFTDIKYDIVPNGSIQKQTEISEDTKVERLDGEDEIILLNTKRKTIISYDGEIVYTKIEKVIKTTRTYTQKGYIYRAYYLDENGELVYLKNTDYLLETKNNIFTNKKYYLERINITDESSTDESTIYEKEEVSNSTHLEIINYNYIQKKIKRVYNYNKINIDEVKMSILQNNDTLESIVVTDDNKLEFFTDNIQKYWLAQCYSKNYPFYVDVIFEQTQ